MSSPAKVARLASAANGFSEIVTKGRNQLVTKNPATGQISLDIGMGDIGWHTASGVEVDTAWEADTGAWQYKMITADYQLHARNMLNAGNLIEYRDPVSNQYVVLQPYALNWVDNVSGSRQQITQPQAVAAQVTDDVLYFPNGYGTGRHFRYTADPVRLIKHLIIDSAANLPAATVSNPYLELEFSMTPSSGVTMYVDGVAWDKKTTKRTSTSIEFRLASGTPVWKFTNPTAHDSSTNIETGKVAGEFQIRKQSNNFYVTVRFPKTWIDTAVFPIVLDPTIDVQVINTTANDGMWATSLNDDVVYLGAYSGAVYNVFARWSGITISAGATIDVAYVSSYYAGAMGTPAGCKIYFNDTATPTAPTTSAEANEKVKTTAYIDQNPPTSGSWNNTGSIVTIIQELMASYTSYSSGAMMMLWIGAGTGNNMSVLADYTNYTTRAMKLHIEYTEAASSSIVPGLMSQYRRRW